MKESGRSNHSRPVSGTTSGGTAGTDTARKPYWQDKERKRPRTDSAKDNVVRDERPPTKKPRHSNGGEKKKKKGECNSSLVSHLSLVTNFTSAFESGCFTPSAIASVETVGNCLLTYSRPNILSLVIMVRHYDQQLGPLCR